MAVKRKKKNNVLEYPEFEMTHYINVEQVFDTLSGYILDVCQNEDDYNQIAEYMIRLGYDGDWSLETAYLKRLRKDLKGTVSKKTLAAYDAFLKAYEEDDGQNVDEPEDDEE